MPIKLTRAEVLALKPCSEDKIPAFGRRKAMTAAQALDAGVSVDDLLWVADRLGRKDLCVKFALACAVRVEHLNTDPRVKACNVATQAWLDNPCDETAAAAAAAGAAAWDAARAAGDAAWAAWAAARAAGGAAWAAWAAARAAAEDAAGAAAEDAAGAAAGDVARAAERAAQNVLFLEIFGDAK